MGLHAHCNGDDGVMQVFGDAGLWFNGGGLVEWSPTLQPWLQE